MRARRRVTPRVSVVTGLSAAGNPFISETYESLLRQTLAPWEWVVVENHGGKLPAAIRKDARVQVRRTEVEGIGAVKRFGCQEARCAVLVELDHDDLLHPEALSEVAAAVARGGEFLYSNFAEFEDGTWAPHEYSSVYGWTARDVEFQGHRLREMVAPPVTAQNLRLVDWTPNHLRAWTRETYDRVGGHDPALKVADDHDLEVRGYLAGVRFAHLDRCLYFYRCHDAQVTRARNAEIRDATWGVYNRRFWALAETWSRREGLLLVDLCGGIDPAPGYLVVDRALPDGEAGVIADLDGEWPMAESSVGLLRAHDAIEHLRDPIHTMNEAYRVLAPGGFFCIMVPSTSGLGAFSDPTHVSFWNRLSFRHYTEAAMARYVPAFKGRFAVSRVLEWFPSPWHQQNNVPYVEAHLFALKPGYRHMGEVHW